MDKLIKEKEQNVHMAMIPLEAVPLIGIRITEASTSTEIPSTIPVQVSDASEKLVKSMEDMSIQGEEIKKLQEEVNNLQELKSMFQASHQEEMHKSQRLSQQLQQLQKETVMEKTLAQAKENIWVDINKSMSEIWPSIQIIFEQHELVQKARGEIEIIKEELGERPTEASELIIFINSKNKQELEELEIEDRTDTILEIKKVLTKKGLMLQLEEKAQVMDIGVQIFFSKFEVLHKKGLPGLLVLNDKLITLSDYKQKMSAVAKDSSKFAGIQGSITGKYFLETLQLDLSIQHEIKHIFITKPTFAKYTEMDEIYRKVTQDFHPR
jgi:hypothetical protein